MKRSEGLVHTAHTCAGVSIAIGCITIASVCNVYVPGLSPRLEGPEYKAIDLRAAEFSMQA